MGVANDVGLLAHHLATPLHLDLVQHTTQQRDDVIELRQAEGRRDAERHESRHDASREQAVSQTERAVAQEVLVDT